MRYFSLAFCAIVVAFSFASAAHADYALPPESGWPAVNGAVLAIVPASDGSVYIGGAFTSVGTSTRNRIAHILVNKTVDPAFDPNVNSDVYALALSSDGATLYAGGLFTTVNGTSTTRNRVASFSTSNGVVTSFNPNATTGQVNALVLSSDDSTLYVGGSFTTIGGSTRNRLASFDMTNSGALTSFDPDMGSPVLALALSSDNATLYAGGYFSTVNGGGTTRNRLASFTPGIDSNATGFDPNMSAGLVYSLVLSADDATLYVGGSFSSVNGGTTRTGLAAFAPNINSTALSLNPNITGCTQADCGGVYVSSLTLSTDESILYAGGDFSLVNGTTRNQFAAFLTSASATLTSFNPNLDIGPGALAISASGTLYMGGYFTTVDGDSNFAKFATFGVPDTTAPVVTVAGDNPLYLTITNPYPEFGATATDDTDGSLAVTTDASSVDMSVAGTYTVTYSATDAALNVGSSTRTVIVNPIAGTVGVGNSISISGGGGGGGSSYTPPPSTGGTTTPADPTAALQAQISLLLKQVADLQAQIAARTGGTIFTKNLKLGDIDPEVKLLQQYLNTHGFIVSDVPGGPGFSGYETEMFGYATRGALIKFQNTHAPDVLTPLGLTSGTGYFGSLTRAYVNAHP